MSTSAPRARVVDALSGKRAPTAFFKALSDADDLITKAALAQADADDAAETISLLLEDNTGLRCRIQELEAERDAALSERDHFRAMAHQWMAQRSAGTAL